MALRDLDIDVDVDVDASDLVRANEQADQLIRTMRELDKTYRIDLEINDKETATQVQAIEIQLKKLTSTPRRINIDVDSAGAMAKIVALQAQLGLLDKQFSVTPSPSFSSASSSSKSPTTRGYDDVFLDINALYDRIANLNKTDIFIDVDIREASNDILNLRRQIKSIDADIDVDVDTSSAHAQLAALQAHMLALKAPNIGIGNSNIMPLLNSVGKSLNSFGGIMSVGKGIGLIGVLPLLASSAMVATGAIGTLGVSVGVLGGGLLSLASAVGIAGIGIGGFAALGITTLIDIYDEKAKLTSAQNALKKETDSVVTSWQNLKKTLEPHTFGAIGSGVGVVNTLLNRSEPLLQRATVAVDGLFDSFDKTLDSDRGVGIFSYLERAVGPLTTNIGNGLGYALQGVFNWMVALEPLTTWVGQGFEDMMQDFADWTHGLQDSERMTAFMDYVMENMPKIGQITGDMTDGVIGFFEAFDVTASDGLTWLVDTMEDFSNWSANLDDNAGFQNMLSVIRNDGPVIAEIIGDISSGVIDITTALTNFGRNEDGSNSFLNFLSGGREFSDKLINFVPAAKVMEWVGSKLFDGPEAPQIDVSVGADTTQAQADIQSLAVDKTLEVPLRAKMDPMATANNIGKLPEIGVYARVEKVDTTQVGPVDIAAQTQGASNNMLSTLGTFKWPALPEFKWPRFEWPAYPRFSWPPIPTVHVKVNVIGGTTTQTVLPNLPGFSTGLGRVQDEEMPVNVHKNEAILHESGADHLRDLGVLQGDGRNPVVDTSHLASTTTTTNNSSSQSTVIEVGGIQITVQGGNTNAETASNLEEKMEEFFAKLGFAMFQPREG